MIRPFGTFFAALAMLIAAGLPVPASPVLVEVAKSASQPHDKESHWLYSESRALVIGIDAYDNGWPRLSQAVSDADIVARALETHGFAVQRLVDPTGQELRDALRRFFALAGAEPEARLVLWFAGHGHTVMDEGYILGADAPPPDDPTFLLEAIHMREFGGLVRLARAKHVYSVFDSCFSGTVFSAQRSAPPPVITQAVLNPVRHFLTSGDAEQLVSDDGTFARLFAGALTGDERADLNADGYLTGSELGLFMETRITNLTSAAQTPRSGKLRDSRYDRGDVVFVLPGSASKPEDIETAETEASLWERIRRSLRQDDYRAFLEAYPSGRYAEQAQQRIELLLQQAGEPPGPQDRPPETQPDTPDTGALALKPPPRSAERPRHRPASPDAARSVQGLERAPEAVTAALAEYANVDELVSGRVEAPGIKALRTEVIAIGGGAVLVEIRMSVPRSWGLSVMTEVFAVAGPTLDDIRILAHGEKARALVGEEN